MQQAHIVAVGLTGTFALQSVVSVAEGQRREQIVAVAVGRERPRLAHERPGDVVVVDGVALAS